MHKVLALIPARGGSKRLPGKNIIDFGGKALITWTIEAAQGASCVSDVCVSTDDEAIAAVARLNGVDVPALRPDAISGDDATSRAVVEYVNGQNEGTYDYIILLQPTSPLRTASDIDQAFEQMVDSGTQSCVSVVSTDMLSEISYTIEADRQTLVKADESSDTGSLYALNGAIYCIAGDHFERHEAFVTPETQAYIMPKNRSVDIDRQADLEYAQSLLNQEHEQR